MIDYDKPDDDPIVAEVRRIREELASQFNFDLHAICENARRQTDEAAKTGVKIVSLAPRRPPNWIPPTKKLDSPDSEF